MRKPVKTLMFAVLVTGALAQPARAQSFLCEDTFKLDDATMQAYRFGPEVPPPAPVPEPEWNPLKLRILKYASFALRHRLSGLASYYSTSLDGTLTANGERYHNRQMSAAHLT